MKTSSDWLVDSVNKWASKATDFHQQWCLKNEAVLGRLSVKEEAAGKMRVFAMVDAFTQWALKPLHQRIMSEISR